jgi:kumamolisin
MTDETRMTPLAGSERTPLAGARSTGRLEPTTPVEVTVYLRPRADGDLAARDEPSGSIISRAELAERRGADPGELGAVEEYATGLGLEVVERDLAGRRLRLRGPASAMEAAFGVQLERFEHEHGSYRGHSGAVRLPGGLAGSVVAVLGLDDRPQAHTHFRPLTTQPAVSYTAVEVAAAYGAPASLSGKGVCVALIELGGGFTTADLAAYFTGLGLAVPTVEAVAVDGGSNSPTGDGSGPDAEVMLDIEVVGAVANGATVAVYFAPNTDQGFADALSAAVHDTTRSPAVISVSWGGPESSYTAQAVTAFEQAFTDAALVGATVLVAAGDSGSSDGVDDGQAHVDYPASSPQVVGCGGTRLTLQAGAIESEVVWNDGADGGATGGGVSATFPLPSWQGSVGVPTSANPGGGAGRGVPDVAGDADPESGYDVRVDGSDTVVGGTSAVAPLYAGFVALAVERAGRPLGFINPRCYAAQASAFRDITSGNNGAYAAGPGWDACTGLGSPIVAALLDVLAAPAASSSTGAVPG